MGQYKYQRTVDVDTTPAKGLTNNLTGQCENAYQNTIPVGNADWEDVFNLGLNPKKLVLWAIKNTGAQTLLVRIGSTNSSGIKIPPGRTLVRFGIAHDNSLSGGDVDEVALKAVSATSTAEVYCLW